MCAQQRVADIALDLLPLALSPQKPCGDHTGQESMCLARAQIWCTTWMHQEWLPIRRLDRIWTHSRACGHFSNITHSKFHTDMGKHFCTPHVHLGIQDLKLYVFIHCQPQSRRVKQLRDRPDGMQDSGSQPQVWPKYRQKRDWSYFCSPW